jgi:hypothetical protein
MGHTHTEKKSTRAVSSTITYGEGPAFHGSTPVWKPCDQTWTSKTSGMLCSIYSETSRRTGNPDTQSVYNRLYVPDIGFSATTPPAPDWSDVTDKFWDAVDLNTGEAVMAYSAVLQAVPLIGGVFKINSVLNKIGKWATKSLRRKPFTEVVKTAISADFINRFVVQTTLDDMHTVANSMNYVMNKVQTAYRRNVEPTAFKPSVSTRSSSQSGTNHVTIGNQRIDFKWTSFGISTRKLFILADVQYDVDPATPLRLWLNRVGLTRPLESAWDLVPFSFVADYFLRTGDFLTNVSQEMSSIEGLKGRVMGIRSMWFTEKRERGITFSDPVVSRPGLSPQYKYDAWIVTPGTSSRTIGEFHRHPFVGDLSQIGFWDRGGLWSPSLSSTRVRTLAQLFIQAKL